jgi:hypothetical protein
MPANPRPLNGITLALALAIRRLQLRQPRPYFAELPYYLWGQVNYDSEGDCKKPTDRQWTWMYLQHRGTREIVDVKQENSDWLVDGDDETSARLAMFLIERSGGASDSSLVAVAGDWDHSAALARTVPVRSEFEQPALAPFDTQWFWGSWKWIGWYATEFTWVGRWIMHSVVRNDPRAISLCIDWIKGTRFAEQAAVLSYAVQRLSGEPARSPQDWVRWYEGGRFSQGAKQRFPEPDMSAWLKELQQQFVDES